MNSFLKWFFLFLVICTGDISFAQKFEWYQPVVAGEHCSSVAMDPDGFYYFTGDVCTELGQQLYFNETPIPYYPDDFLYAYLVKTDASYNPEWLKVVQAGGYVGVNRLKTDHDENLIYSCSYAGSIRIGTHFIYSNLEDYSALIAKISPNGNVIWAVTMKSNSYYIRILDFAIDDENNVLVTANFMDNITISTDDSSITYNSDAYGGLISKFSSNGELINAIAINSSSNFKFKGVECDQNLNIITTGWWSGIADFSGQILTSNYSDIFIAKYDSDLNMDWIKQIGSKTNSTILEFGSDVALDKADNIFISGTVLGNPDFGNGSVSAGVKNIFLASYQQNGTLRWLRLAGGNNGMASYCEQGQGVYIDNDDFIFLTGEFGPSADFEGQTILAHDDPANSNLYFDVFVAKYFANGELSWVTHAGHKNYDDVSGGIIKDVNNNLVLIGSTRNLSQYGENFLRCDYSYPGFIVQLGDTLEENRYDDSGLADKLNDNRPLVVVYPNPFTDYVTFFYELDQTQITSLSIYDLFGVLVDKKKKQQFSGENIFTWYPDVIASGVYYYRININGKMISGKILHCK